MRGRRGCGCLEMHTNEGGMMGRFACLSARPRVGYLYESESTAIQCTLHSKRWEEGEKGKSKSKERESCRRHSVWRRMRKASSIQIRNRECIACQGATASTRSKGVAVVEVRWQKGNERKLRKGATSPNRETRQMKTYGNEANDPINSRNSEE